MPGRPKKVCGVVMWWDGVYGSTYTQAIQRLKHWKLPKIDCGAKLFLKYFGVLESLLELDHVQIDGSNIMFFREPILKFV